MMTYVVASQIKRFSNETGLGGLSGSVKGAYLSRPTTSRSMLRPRNRYALELLGSASRCSEASPRLNR